MSEQTKPAYLFWATVFSSAMLVGFAITGFMPWWAVIIPWVVYGIMVLIFLVLVFLLAFIGTLIVGLMEFKEEKRREKSYKK